MAARDVALGTLETAGAVIFVLLGIVLLLRVRRTPAGSTLAGREFRHPRLAGALVLVGASGLAAGGVGHLRGGPAILQVLALVARVATVVLIVVFAVRNARGKPTGG
jgi:hypothetical protein